VQQANQHVHFLVSFMPDSFLARGSEFLPNVKIILFIKLFNNNFQEEVTEKLRMI